LWSRNSTMSRSFGNARRCCQRETSASAGTCGADIPMRRARIARRRRAAEKTGNRGRFSTLGTTRDRPPSRVVFFSNLIRGGYRGRTYGYALDTDAPILTPVRDGARLASISGRCGRGQKEAARRSATSGNVGRTTAIADCLDRLFRTERFRKICRRPNEKTLLYRLQVAGLVAFPRHACRGHLRSAGVLQFPNNAMSLHQHAAR
jgi:hypothetical protein